MCSQLQKACLTSLRYFHNVFSAHIFFSEEHQSKAMNAFTHKIAINLQNALKLGFYKV